MARFARRLLLASGLAFALGQACIAPTLPLPPPDDPEVTAPTAERMVTLSGRVPQPRARVFSINYTQAEAGDDRAFGGDLADSVGDYIFEMRGEVGDNCVLWYEYAGEESQPRFFEIPAPSTARP